MKNRSAIVTFIIILVGVGMILTYSSIFKLGGNIANTPPRQPQAVTPNTIQANSYTYQGEEGKTALQILKEKFSVETKSTNYGEMVISINNKKADNQHFWAFKINGKMATQGAENYQTKPNDKITWELTEIK